MGLCSTPGRILEIDVVDGAALAVAVDQVDQRIADALDGRDVELHRPDLALDAPGAERQGALVGDGRVLHPEGDGADAGPVHAGEALGEAVLLGVDDEVHVALAVERDVLGAVLGDPHEAHALEQRAERRRIGRGVFDELEAVGAHRIDLVDLGDVGLLTLAMSTSRIDPRRELVSYVTIMANAAQALELENFLPYRLSILAQIVSESLHDLYAGPFDLTVTQWRVMAALGRFAPLTASDVGQRIVMDKVAVSRAVAGLMKRGLVERATDRNDRRRASLRLRPAAAPCMRASCRWRSITRQRLYKALSAEERRSFDALSDRLFTHARQLRRAG